MKTPAERWAFTRQSRKRNGEWKIANGMISCWTQREARSKKLSRNICECTTLTAKRRTIGLEKRRTRMCWWVPNTLDGKMALIHRLHRCESCYLFESSP